MAKCVNAASITPVATFDTTQSYVTSTPVRTALSDTCSLIPAPPSSTSSFSSMVPQHFTSSLCSRTAELAQQLVTADRTNVCRTGDCSSPTTSINASWSLDDQALVTSSDNQSPVIATNTSTSSESRHQDVSLGESSNISGFELTLETRSSDQHEDDSVFDDQNLLDEFNLSSKKITEESVTRDDDLKGEDSTVTKSPEATSSSAQEKRIRESRKELEMSRGGHHQRVGSKKSRKKKGISLSKRSFSETDKGGTTGERNEIGTKDVRRTVSEDEDRSRLNDDVDDETSRAITEIPEVTVVGGGSFVPKDLCSTGILTSRVLTAPSRATYTTAYI